MPTDHTLLAMINTHCEAQGLKLKTTLTHTADLTQLTLCAGFPIPPHRASTLKKTLQQALEQALPHHPQINITLTQQIEAHQTQLAGKGLRNIKNTIAIASGKGGVGKSTVTVNLAAALARAGARVGILDADIYGPSIPTMLGHTEPPMIENDRYLPILAHGIQAMSMGFLVKDDDALIWRGPMLAKALIQLIDLTQWDNLDYLLIDLPPGTGDIPLTLVQKIPLTGAVVVTTPQNVATLDAIKAIKMFQKTNITLFGLIENMSTHLCENCGHESTIFGQGGAKKLATETQTPFLGQLPLTPRITHECDAGQPSTLPVFDDIAMQVAQGVSQTPLNYAGRFPPIVSA